MVINPVFCTVVMGNLLRIFETLPLPSKRELIIFVTYRSSLVQWIKIWRCQLPAHMSLFHPILSLQCYCWFHCQEHLFASICRASWYVPDQKLRANAIQWFSLQHKSQNPLSPPSPFCGLALSCKALMLQFCWCQHTWTHKGRPTLHLLSLGDLCPQLTSHATELICLGPHHRLSGTRCQMGVAFLAHTWIQDNTCPATNSCSCWDMTAKKEHNFARNAN